MYGCIQGASERALSRQLVGYNVGNAMAGPDRTAYWLNEVNRMNDYLERIRGLQAHLRAEGTGGAVLAGTDQMRYLTGWREGGHERFVGLLVPAEGSPAFLVPAMNAEQAQQTPAGIAHRQW